MHDGLRHKTFSIFVCFGAICFVYWWLINRIDIYSRRKMSFEVDHLDQHDLFGFSFFSLENVCDMSMWFTCLFCVYLVKVV